MQKDEKDIQMVCNGTSSCMNTHLWAHWSALPTICALLKTLEVDTYMADLDIGYMFLNFMSKESCTKLAGVDYGKRHLVRWIICITGGTVSPYNMGQCMGHAKEDIMGNLNDTLNCISGRKCD
jgi:hypothetical protein